MRKTFKTFEPPKTLGVRRHRCKPCNEIFECEDCTRAMHADFTKKIPRAILYSFSVAGMTEENRDNPKLDSHFVCPKCKPND